MADKQITVTVPEETHQAFKRACLDLSTTMSKILRRAINDAITNAALVEELRRTSVAQHPHGGAQGVGDG